MSPVSPTTQAAGRLRSPIPSIGPPNSPGTSPAGWTKPPRYADLSATLLVASTTYGYDNANRLTSLTHAQNSTTLAAYTWTYDAIGRLTATTNPDGSSSFVYDASSQLADADHSYQTDEAYEYDANGNRTNTGYTTGTNNRLTSDGTFDYEYDDEGNRTKKTNIATDDYVSYSWDHRNRLTAVSFYDDQNVLQKKVAYTYDVNGRLISKEVDEDGDSDFDSAQKFVYDGPQLILVFDNSDDLEHRYLTGLLDQVFADEDAMTEILWTLADNQGTIRGVAKRNSGTSVTSVVNHVKYDSFGNITAQSDSSKQPLFAYTGLMFDEDSELQYSRAQWYDPKVGRFLSEDPLSFAAGDVNLSRYVGNDPIVRQAIFFAYCRAGEMEAARDALDQFIDPLLDPLNHYWDKEIEQAKALMNQLETSPADAQRQLDAWEAESARNLKLEKYR